MIRENHKNLIDSDKPRWEVFDDKKNIRDGNLSVNIDKIASGTKNKKALDQKLKDSWGKKASNTHCIA